MPWSPRRGKYGEHSMDVVEHIEEHNCSKGCVHGAKSKAELAEWGPGGTCRVLAAVALAVDTVTEVDDDGTVLRCTAFEARPVAERKPRRRPGPPNQLTIEGTHE